jgi:hypothetical protein
MEDDDEMSPQRDAFREHMRAMTAARQAAEHAHARRPLTPAARQQANLAFQVEMARIDAEHRAWLREHGSDPDSKPPTRTRRGK